METAPKLELFTASPFREKYSLCKSFCLIPSLNLQRFPWSIEKIYTQNSSYLSMTIDDFIILFTYSLLPNYGKVRIVKEYAKRSKVQIFGAEINCMEILHCINHGGFIQNLYFTPHFQLGGKD